ncbi:hypothetical protein [Streptomyces sp. CT34]|uniref:hypothetical protein n=1 Tax=Streptomyces sp. CT34 TaxID=1553907 RepID=UPI0005BC5CDC|nr:hypothetical protein [Streptomyces sp. CT34]
MPRELDHVDESFFSDEPREQATATGVALVNALRRLGVDLPDIELLAPCENCDHEYSFRLGQVGVEDAQAMAHAIDHRLDVLEAISQQWNRATPQVAEVDDL